MRRRLSWAALVAFALATSTGAQDATGPDVVLPDPIAVVGAPKGLPVSGEALEALTTAVASKLRCPVCQGLSVQDSPTGGARNMRDQVQEMLARGFDEEQVFVYFETSYGEFVRLEPPMRGINWLVWLAPLLGLALGGAGAFFAWRQLVARGTAPVEAVTALPDRDRLPDDPALAAAVLKVRERVWGWPGGLSPERRAPGERGEA